MERPILLLFERRQLIIPQRQPFSSSTVFAPFIDSRARMSSRVCFWASPPDVKDIGGGEGWLVEPMKIQISAFLISKRGTPASQTGPRLWRQPCQQSRTNLNEETQRPLFPPSAFIAALASSTRFFLYIFASRPPFIATLLRFFSPWTRIRRREGDNSSLSRPR